MSTFQFFVEAKQFWRKLQNNNKWQRKKTTSSNHVHLTCEDEVRAIKYAGKNAKWQNMSSLQASHFANAFTWPEKKLNIDNVYDVFSFGPVFYFVSRSWFALCNLDHIYFVQSKILNSFPLVSFFLFIVFISWPGPSTPSKLYRYSSGYRNSAR